MVISLEKIKYNMNNDIIYDFWTKQIHTNESLKRAKTELKNTLENCLECANLNLKNSLLYEYYLLLHLLGINECDLDFEKVFKQK